MRSLCLLLALAVGQKRLGLVEEHNHVLVHLMNASKHGLPSQGVTLIHFDSHADMANPGYFPPSIMSAFDAHPENIVSATEINNWVTASWLLGIVDRMVFIEPPWGSEFRVVAHRELVYYAGTVNDRFKLDILTTSGVRVAPKYWHTVDDGSLPDPVKHFADHTTMSNKRRIEVLIVPFEEIFTTLVPFVQRTPNASLFLDIDLDCFSTESPAHLALLRQAGIPLRHQQLAADMYHRRLPPFNDLASFTTEWWRSNLRSWQTQCPDLLSVFEGSRLRIKDGRPSDTPIILPRDVPPSVSRVDPEGIVAKLYDAEAGDHGDEVRDLVVGLLQVYEGNLQGLTDELGLKGAALLLSRALGMPIHLGTTDEINVMIGAVECVLSQLKDFGRTPTLITLARSPYYTPVHHLKHIECETLEFIRRLYPDMVDIFHEGSLEPDYSECDLGFNFHDIGNLVQNNFQEERTERGTSTPVELIVANTSPEELVMYWQDSEGDWIEQLRVPPYSYEGDNWVSHHDHVLAAKTIDGYTVSQLIIDGERGHTQLWTITTGDVDSALRNHSITRHRDI